MRIRNVSLCPAPQASAAGRDSLTPELLASVGARYSRDDEGLDSILDRVRGMDPERAVDSIFRHLDSGHASLLDMVPVAIFMDDIPIFDAYYLWSICPLAGGQESSTRYIRMDEAGLPDSESLGIKDAAVWRESMRLAFDAYHKALTFWEGIAADNPKFSRIPQSLLADQSDKSKKQVARMLRNYAFDRARVFLPVAATTNVMMVQSARAWARAVQILLSHPLPSLNALGEGIRGELELSAPRSVKHAREDESAKMVLRRCFDRDVSCASYFTQNTTFTEMPCAVYVETNGAESGWSYADILLEDIQDRSNRYSLVGEILSSCPVTYKFEAIAMAELRDMNRHRTGSKRCSLVPLGFYTATDQIPDSVDATEYAALAKYGLDQSERALQLLREGDPSYIYYSLLGTQYSFTHTTTADKFLYTMELRTGVGSHYRYAEHCHDLLELWYAKFPKHRGVIFEGVAEPE